jgi:hypothetical protein
MALLVVMRVIADEERRGVRTAALPVERVIDVSTVAPVLTDYPALGRDERPVGRLGRREGGRTSACPTDPVVIHGREPEQRVLEAGRRPEVRWKLRGPGTLSALPPIQATQLLNNIPRASPASLG